MSANGEILESGRKRARTEEASSSNKALQKASTSNILRANVISKRLSTLLTEFPEIKFILDFENLQANVEIAVVKYIEEKEANKHEAQLLLNYGQESVLLHSLPDEVLSKCLSYVGKGHYGSLALVSKKLNEAYKDKFGQETAYLEMATSVNLANHCLNDLCKSSGEKDEILKAAAVNGNIDVLRAAVKDGYDLFPLVALKKKTRNPNVDSDEDMYDGDSRDNGDNYESDENVDETFDVYYADDCERQSSGRPETVNLTKLIKRGHLHILKYLHEELNFFLGLQRYWKPAIQYGKLEIMKWLHEIGIMDNTDLCIGFFDDGYLNTDFDYCKCAIKSGNVEALKWLQEVRGYNINDDNSFVLADAIESKSLKMIQYCFHLGYNNLNTSVVESAMTKTKSVEVFRFMHELGYEFEGMNMYYWSNDIVDYFEIIKFLRSISVPWDDSTMKDIVGNGTLEMIKYAQKDGCAWTGKEFSHLFKSKSWNMDEFKYLIDNGCTFDYKQSSDLIEGLARSKELLPFDYFVGKNSKFDNKLFKKILKCNGDWSKDYLTYWEKAKMFKTLSPSKKFSIKTNG